MRKRLDGQLPGWRNCMSRLAASVMNDIDKDPGIILIQRLHHLFQAIDPAEPTHLARLDRFVRGMEEETVRPVPGSRVLELLGAAPR
jgi:hypothetical protein